MKAYLVILFVAAATTYLLVPVVRQTAIFANAVTPVRDRDVHTAPIPRLGGVAMTGGFLVAMLVASNSAYLGPVFENGQGKALAFGAFALCLLGVVDDLWDIDWLLKLGGQIVIAVSMALGGVQLVSFPIFGITIGSSRLSLLATVLVIVVCINAVNFVDGLDGLAAGVIAIGAGGFFVYAYMLVRMTNEASYSSLAATIIIALMGICLGFLPHNFNPASIFMGDSGSMVLGLISSGAAIIITGQIDPAQLGRSQIVAAVMPIVLPFAILLLPILDMVMAILRRLRTGNSVFSPDRMHLHHRLLDASGSHRKAVLLMYLLAAVVSSAAASLVVLRWSMVAIILVPALFVVAVVFILTLPGLRARIFGVGTGK